MKYLLQPTLRQMALVKIVAELWNQDDIRKMIKCYDFSNYPVFDDKEWLEVEDEIVIKVPHLPLPKPLKKDLLCIIRPIGHQIKAWCFYHGGDMCQISTLPTHFHWTCRGTIDRKRMAEMLVKDDQLHVTTRYELSCIYCLENEIPELWNQIPELIKSMLYIDKSVLNYEMNSLVEFWSYQLVDQLSKLGDQIERFTGQSNPHVYALHRAVADGNVVATEFFLDKLSDEERNTLLVRYTGTETVNHGFSTMNSMYGSEVVYYLLSRMTEDQLIQTTTTTPFTNFDRFLNYPFQPLFISFAQHTTHLIPEVEHILNLASIVYVIANGWTDFDYRQLFYDYWSLLSSSCKKRSIQSFHLLLRLLEAEEESILKFMLKDADAIDKEQFILSQGLDICENLVEDERWRSLELIIEMCGPSKEGMEKLKEGLMERHSMSDLIEGEAENQRKWETLFWLFDHLLAEKRKAEDNANKLAENV